MRDITINIKTENFDTGSVQLNIPEEIETVELVINGDAIYTLHLPVGSPSKNIEIQADICGVNRD